MLVRINGLPVIDEQEKLYQDVSESFARLIYEFRKKHWFREFIYSFTGGEDLINTDRIKAKLWYWKLVITLKSLRVLLKISPPSEEQAEKMVVALEALRAKLEGEQ